MKEFFLDLLNILFPPKPLGVLDVTSRQYFERLERTRLPFRPFNEYVGRVVPDSLKEGPAPPPPPPPGTREQRRLSLESC